MYRILNTIGSRYSQKGKDILKKFGEVDYLDLTQEELENYIVDYDALFMQLEVKVTRRVIDNAKNLKVIATATTGLDHIDVEYAKSKGIEILSLKNETEFLNEVPGTAELAFGLMIDLMRHTLPASDSVKKYEWNNERFRGHNLYKATLGLVGFGRLGKLMAKYANAFGMSVIAYDPYVEDSVFLVNNCKRVTFDELLKDSDVISIHVHLSPETEKMFNALVLSKMKQSAYLINTSRGKIVDEKAILEALNNKIIAGYGTDVLADELNFKESFRDHPLVEYAKYNNNLIIVPHIGGTTYESREATDIFIAKKMRDYFSKYFNLKIDGKRTIFITMSRGGTARNILQTDAYKILKESGHRLVILTPAYFETRFLDEFRADNVFFENLIEPKWNFWDRFLVGWYKALVYNDSTKKRDLYGIYNPDEGSAIKYIFKKIFFLPLSKLQFLKEFFRWLDQYLIKDRYYGEIFDKYNPDIVFSTSVMEDADIFVLKQAKQRKIKTIGMPKTWDNTSKLVFRVKTDKLIVWGDFSKDEAIKFQNYEFKDLIMCGIPQFDFYKNTDYLLTKKEFCDIFNISENKKIIVFCSEGKTTKNDGDIARMIVKFIDDNKLREDAILLIRPHFMYPNDEQKFAQIIDNANVVLDDGYKHSSVFRDRWDYSKEQIKRFTNIMAHSDVVVTSYSSVSLDAAAFDKPIINIAFDGYVNLPHKESIVRWYETEYYKHVVNSGGVWMVKNESELFNAINTYLTNPRLLADGREKLRSYFMYQVDGKSGERIGRAVLNYLNN